MADYKVTDTELTSIANAIRAKGGTQAQLEFPAGFVSAVQAIPTGGGGITITPRDYAKFSGRSFEGVILPFLLDENTGVEIEFMFTSNNQYQQPFGVWDTGASGNLTWIRACNEFGGQNAIYIGDGTQNGQSVKSVPNTYNVKHKITTNINGHSYVDDTIEYPYTPTAPGRDIPLVIGGNRVTTSASYFMGRIYSYKLFNRSTGVQLANIYPVTLNSSNPQIVGLDGLYDSINDKFYDGGIPGNLFTCEDEV